MNIINIQYIFVGVKCGSCDVKVKEKYRETTRENEINE